MISGFMSLIHMGHFYCACLVVWISHQVWSEIIAMKKREDKEKNVNMRVIEWLSYVAVNLLVLPQIFFRRILIEHSFSENKYLLKLLLVENHLFIAMVLFIVTFLVFVLSLRKGYVRYYFSRLAWIMFANIFGPALTLLQVFMIYKGLYWLLFPFMAVIINDIFAYLFGFFLGRTPLIQLSPKKTWEGFVGGIIGTFLWSIFSTLVLTKSSLMICPQPKLTLALFENLDCEPHYVFMPTEYIFQLPIIGATSFFLQPVIFHSIIIGVFASIVAPFGGFFASGVKRAFNIKDFGDLIPGHGGVTDRFDCQIIMSGFLFIYANQIMFRSQYTIEKALDYVSLMDLEEKGELLAFLHN